ncbi:zinc-dependent alcohol dehydrogenase [Catelliglobosispora koreensis]|uniref:zinc-dependent alcohol dehydrogenase n=1 Tax=Catelliglobosispora koreensis TaxID=129052 RepID=UPI0003761F4F|nr:alcohol dehydrogenase catalytic domain-containing protein [Catelliglobosispora koreensis]
MRQVMYAGNRIMSVTDVRSVPPGPGEVQIRVAYTGICGTDLHILHGDMDARVGPSAVLGHEMSGTVAECGPGVSGWTPGDPVTVMPVRSCGGCRTCKSGNAHICPDLEFLGIDSPGAMQELWTVPATLLVSLPRGLDLAHAALVEPTAVAVHDVRRAELRAGERVLVAGGGPIGQLIALVAGHAGADVLVLEPDPYRRKVAAELGLACADPANADALHEWHGGHHADVAFEVSGAAAGIETAIEQLCPRGRLVLVAIHARPREVNLHRFFWRELTLLGARLYSRSDVETAVHLLATGAIPAAALISRIEPLERTTEAFEALENGDGVMKVLLDCRGQQ